MAGYFTHIGLGSQYCEASSCRCYDRPPRSQRSQCASSDQTIIFGSWHGRTFAEEHSVRCATTHPPPASGDQTAGFGSWHSRIGSTFAGECPAHSATTRGHAAQRKKERNLRRKEQVAFLCSVGAEVELRTTDEVVECSIPRKSKTFFSSFLNIFLNK